MHAHKWEAFFRVVDCKMVCDENLAEMIMIIIQRSSHLITNLSTVSFYTIAHKVTHGADNMILVI